MSNISDPEQFSWEGWDNAGATHEDEDDFNEEQTHPLFTEMAELTYDKFGHWQWKEVARWVKYEENVEEGGHRWSKPFVPTVQLHTLYHLRSLIENKTICLLLNIEPEPLEIILPMVLDEWISNGMIQRDQKSEILHMLQSQKAHLYQRRTRLQLMNEANEKKFERGIVRDSARYRRSSDIEDRRNSFIAVKPKKQRKRSSSISSTKSNSHFMKKLTSGSETFMILVGELNCIEKPISIFIRFSEGNVLGNLTEVKKLPTRFFFVLLGPRGGVKNYHQVGRSLATTILDSSFREVAYTTSNREGLLKGLDQYLNAVTVLPPPPEWDPTIRIEPQQIENDDDEEVDAEQMLNDSGLARTGLPFGGFIKDIKRKAPWYLSDFRDGISIQCIATWLFLYFACLTPIITFGGLLGLATHNFMGTMETLVAACICGITFALFGGQPLLILGATGPILVFEKILVTFCETYEDLHLNYLELRLWVGIWVGIILIILVAVEASSLVAYITKFTEENFATLIALIFMVEAIKNLVHISDSHDTHSNDTLVQSDPGDGDIILAQHDIVLPNATLHHDNFDKPTNVFLLSILLFLGTFFISFIFKEFRTSSFFSTRIRYMISDFAVIIAILCMSGINAAIGLPTPKLVVPTKFAPTIPDRGWLVSPIGTNPVWTIFAAIIPALLATILIFMDQQITAVIINRKSHKLRKGAGYHLDLFILAILIVVNSFLGLPWFVAATVESVTNLNSLRLESESAAPGEKPHFLGVREQRLSNLCIYITVGLSVFLTPVLQHVPMPVLYGVFLYMGFSALRKMELFERIQLIFMPIKYQPDRNYISQVPILKVHFYTLIQISCLGLLWTIKSIPTTAILFPLMLVVMIAVRKSLDYGFTQKELAALDDILPGAKGKGTESEDDKK